MARQPRLLVSFEHHHGAVPQRIDHFQLLVPDVRAHFEFYMAMGFRLSEYIAPDGSDDPIFVFLQRKGNPHDIVFAPGAGPRFHHAAFAIPESYLFFYVCDLAASMGFADNIEFGPGRHGPGHALFVYMRDPDGHRIRVGPASPSSTRFAVFTCRIQESSGFRAASRPRRVGRRVDLV